MTKSLYGQLLDAREQAFRAKDVTALSLYRLVLAKAEYFAVQDRVSLEDDENTLKAIRAEVREIGQTMETYKSVIDKDGALELYQAEEAKIKILEKYLPRKATEVEVEAWVLEFLNEKPDGNVGDLMGKINTIVKEKSLDVDRRLVVDIFKGAKQQIGGLVSNVSIKS